MSRSRSRSKRQRQKKECRQMKGDTIAIFLSEHYYGTNIRRKFMLMVPGWIVDVTRKCAF